MSEHDREILTPAQVVELLHASPRTMEEWRRTRSGPPWRRMGNPPKARVGTRRRVRRTLPEWMELENRPDVPDEDLTHYDGVPATTVRRALEDTLDRMPPDRREALVVHALRRELIGEQDNDTRRGLHPEAVDQSEKSA
ncbi:hypothetical protein [Microbacterium sp. 18062]|uniref:hypothetical protein n=1 Tax=Microbacterium sp. 18062 TaxID=2681410 RepID=UPI00135962A0|nr:hypothetical protein [Microbacterium sp. 18062]